MKFLTGFEDSRPRSLQSREPLHGVSPQSALCPRCQGLSNPTSPLPLWLHVPDGKAPPHRGHPYCEGGSASRYELATPCGYERRVASAAPFLPDRGEVLHLAPDSG